VIDGRRTPQTPQPRQQVHHDWKRRGPMSVTVSALPTAALAEGGQGCSVRARANPATTCRSNLSSLRAIRGTSDSVIHHLAHIEMRRAANGAETSSDAVLPHREHLTRRGTVSPISKRDIPETANPLQAPRKIDRATPTPRYAIPSASNRDADETEANLTRFAARDAPTRDPPPIPHHAKLDATRPADHQPPS